MKYVDQSDLENKEITELRIRRGCNNICACLGTCYQVVGHINRAEYEEFIKNYVSLEDFLSKKVDE